MHGSLEPWVHKSAWFMGRSRRRFADFFVRVGEQLLGWKLWFQAPRNPGQLFVRILLAVVLHDA